MIYIASSAREAEVRTRCQGIVLNSAVVPQRLRKFMGYTRLYTNG